MNDSISILHDRTGFPMVWIEPIEAWMHVLPFTKIQLEYFLVDTNKTHFDHKWYKKRLSENPRISPQDIDFSNYCQAFATSLVPLETEQIGLWLGQKVVLPTHEEWLKAYRHLKGVSWDQFEWISQGKGTKRVKTLIQKVDAAVSEKTQNKDKRQTMADRMLMRWGVLEWVHYNVGRYEWGVIGETNVDFQSLMVTPEQGPQGALHPELDRFFYYGFRFLMKEES